MAWHDDDESYSKILYISQKNSLYSFVLLAFVTLPFDEMRLKKGPLFKTYDFFLYLKLL